MVRVGIDPVLQPRWQHGEKSMKAGSVQSKLFALGFVSLFVVTLQVARAAEVRVMISGGLSAAYKDSVP